MIINIVSDLHLEFGSTVKLNDNADLVILAGDTHVGENGILWAQNFSKVPVMYILGNHEYYRNSYPKLISRLKDLANNSNIHVLENETFVMGDICFHGATLWTDFNLYDNRIVAGMLCQQNMNDFRLIRRDPSYSAIRPQDLEKVHLDSLSWLKRSLTESSSKYNIVITHHAPSILSVPTDFQNDLVSAAYASNLEQFILETEPDYWIHGHIHTPVNYKIGNTTILSNPKGYPGQRIDFDPGFIIEIN